MAEFIWKDRCMDCYGIEKTLLCCPLSLVPIEAQKEEENILLCEKCINIREEDVALGKEMRPLGIPADIENAEWVEIGMIKIVPKKDVSDQNISVKVLYEVSRLESPTTLDGGRMRYKIGDRAIWFPGPFFDPGMFGVNKERAMREVRLLLAYQFTEDLYKEVVIDKIND